MKNKRFLDWFRPGDMVYTPFYDEEHPEESVVLELRVTGTGFEGFTVSQTIEDPDAMDAVIPWSGYNDDWFFSRDTAQAALAWIRDERSDGWTEDLDDG